MRFLLPYLTVAFVVLILGAGLYTTAAIGFLGVYATGLAAILIAGTGYARWEEKQYGPGARHH